MGATDRGGNAVMPDGIRPVAHVGDAPDLWLLAAAFTGSLCLFLLEPFAGKFLLPRFGGAPAVWVSCLAFFQLALVAGYFFADRVLLVAALTLTAGWRLTRHAPRSTHEQAMRSDPAVGSCLWPSTWRVSSSCLPPMAVVCIGSKPR